jgi:hypothetical protein
VLSSGGVRSVSCAILGLPPWTLVSSWGIKSPQVRTHLCNWLVYTWSWLFNWLFRVVQECTDDDGMVDDKDYRMNAPVKDFQD